MKRQSKLDGERVLIVALVRFSLSVCLRGRDHVVLFLWVFFFACMCAAVFACCSPVNYR